jgi:hypothetical protein
MAVAVAVEIDIHRQIHPLQHVQVAQVVQAAAATVIP